MSAMDPESSTATSRCSSSKLALSNVEILLVILEHLAQSHKANRDRIRTAFRDFDPYAYHDLLEKSTRQDLCNASLVCKSWTCPALQRLDMTLALNNGTNSDRIESLLAESRLTGESMPYHQILLRITKNDPEKCYFFKELVFRSRCLRNMTAIYETSAPLGGDLVTLPAHQGLTGLCFSIRSTMMRPRFNHPGVVGTTSRYYPVDIVYKDLQHALLALPNLTALCLNFGRSKVYFTRKDLR